jgi:DNA-3-methyladenine glycosylase II
MRLIEGADDIAEGLAALTAAEPRFAAALDRVGTVPLRREPGGPGGLLRIVAAQQVSTAAAAAIWGRLAAAGADRPEGLARLDEDALRACGLSRPKARYARALACAAIDWEAVAAAPEAEAVATLTALPGVGRWTAEIYLMFCVGRADVFAPGDLALQEGSRLLFGLPERPGPAALSAMSGAWSPWRAVAARLLWAYYGAERGRAGAPP